MRVPIEKLLFSKAGYSLELILSKIIGMSYTFFSLWISKGTHLAPSHLVEIASKFQWVFEQLSQLLLESELHKSRFQTTPNRPHEMQRIVRDLKGKRWRQEPSFPYRETYPKLGTWSVVVVVLVLISSCSQLKPSSGELRRDSESDSEPRRRR